MASTVHVAPVVLTLTGPPLRDGAVAVVGDRVVAVGPAAAVVAARPAARVRRHAGVLTPGMVDAHTHLELGPSFAGLPLDDPRPVTDDSGWLVEARGSVHALLRSGTTCVADVVHAGPGVRAAALAGLAGVSHVADGAGDRVRLAALVAAAGRTPSIEVRESCSLSARVQGASDSTTGVGAAGPPAAEGAARVVCPRRDARLGRAPAPIARLLAAGTPFAVGTCCLAVVPDLDLLGELRAARDLALAQGAPAHGLAEALVRAVTVDAAALLGLPGSGVLAVGCRADLAVFDVPADGDPWEALVEHGAGRCTATVLAGRLVHRR